MEAPDELAGGETSCSGCGRVTVVPIDLDCGEGLAAPDVQTITLEELRALGQRP
jgi:hypothetical protein